MYGCQRVKGGGMYWDIEICIYTTVYKIDKMITYCIEQLYSMLNGKEIQKREDMCVSIADSLCCRTEANTTL